VTDALMPSRSAFARAYLDAVGRCLDALPADDVAKFVACLERAYAADRQIFIMGNGGSAATASHLACDLRKSVRSPGDAAPCRPIRVTSLTDNIAVVTALANDHGYDRVFSEQLDASLERGDLVIAISASGNSPNVLNAVALARERGATVAALLGFDGGRVRRLADVALVVDSHDYGRVEDIHLVVGHLVAAWMRHDLPVGVP
jgi:D-sedoheptulose 7-phosphate isomerase